MVTFKGSVIALEGTFPAKGHKACDFLLVNSKLENRKLENYVGRRKIIVTAPSIDTQVCSTSAKKFNDYAKKNSNLVILFVSADLPFAQGRFCGVENVHNIETLSMMRNKDFARDYGLLIKTGPLEGLIARAVIALDESNTVTYSELVSEITHEPNYEALFNS